MRVGRNTASLFSLITLSIFGLFVAFQNCGPAPLKGSVAESSSQDPASPLNPTNNPSAPSEPALTQTKAQLLATPNLTASPGQALNFTVVFEAVPLPESLTVFVHFVDAAGATVHGADFQPSISTALWSGRFTQLRSTNLPSNMAAGLYTIRLGLSRPSPHERFPLLTGPGVSVDDQMRYTVGTVTVSASASAGPACRTSQLVTHYKLNHLPGTTTVSDLSGNNIQGTLLNADAANVWALGKIGNGLILDGIDDALSLGTPAVLTNMRSLTLCAWNRLDAGFGYDPRIYFKSADSSGNSGVGLLISSSDRVLHFRYPWGPAGPANDGFWEARGQQLAVGQWAHYCASYDASSPNNNPTLYINGAPVAVTRMDWNGTPVAPAGDDSGFPAMIGNRHDFQRPFKGFLDDVRIYNTVLTLADIQTIYNSGSGCQ